jgi:hypothetical protein
VHRRALQLGITENPGEIYLTGFDGKTSSKPIKLFSFSHISVESLYEILQETRNLARSFTGPVRPLTGSERVLIVRTVLL